ncbi:MAG TPA: hydroxymethylbilane synthase [Longimicrobiales bacterium]
MMRIASRGSTLALWQAEHVRARLRALRHDVDVEIQVVHTTGDRITDVPLAKIGDRGLFTKEVDTAVLEGRCDLAVHSLKDVPTALPAGLTLAAVMEREDPRDAFLPRPGGGPRLTDLPAGARVGTSSLRRRALLLAARGDLVVDDLRGNLDTRLEKLHDGRYDGIILALAGLRRFGREEVAGELLDLPHWLPAVGQGALALVTREDDTAALEAVRPLNHSDSRAATAAERAFLAALEGGCQIPIAALGTVRGTQLMLRGLVASLDGRTVVRGEAEGAAGDARAVGDTLARRLLDEGAGDVLSAIRSDVGPTPEPAAP